MAYPQHNSLKNNILIVKTYNKRENNEVGNNKGGNDDGDKGDDND